MFQRQISHLRWSWESSQWLKVEPLPSDHNSAHDNFLYPNTKGLAKLLNCVEKQIKQLRLKVTKKKKVESIFFSWFLFRFYNEDLWLLVWKSIWWKLASKGLRKKWWKKAGLFSVKLKHLNGSYFFSGLVLRVQKLGKIAQTKSKPKQPNTPPRHLPKKPPTKHCFLEYMLVFQLVPNI